jgi:hypothetical protein
VHLEQPDRHDGKRHHRDRDEGRDPAAHHAKIPNRPHDSDNVSENAFGSRLPLVSKRLGHGTSDA